MAKDNDEYGSCVCNKRKRQKCRYHAIYPKGRPYERLLPTPFLNAMQRLDKENMQEVDSPDLAHSQELKS